MHRRDTSCRVTIRHGAFDTLENSGAVLNQTHYSSKTIEYSGEKLFKKLYHTFLYIFIARSICLLKIPSINEGLEDIKV